YNPRSYESFEIFLNISSSNDNELELEWSYNTQLFSSVLIHDMMEDFVGIIKQVCDNPNIIIEDIKIKKAYQAKAPIQIPEIIEVAPFKEEAHLTTIIPPTIDVLVAPAALATMALSNPLDIVQIKPIEEGNKVAEAATTAPEEVVMSDEPEIANAGETDELLRQVNEWNSTALSYRESTITAMVESMAATQPDSPAIVFEGLTTTYKQLNNKANQIAKLLVEMNIKPGQGVGLCLHRSPLMVAGLLGILKAGAAYIPIDPVYPKERIAYMLAQSQATVLITENRLAHNTYSNTRNVIIDDELTNLTRFFVDNIQTPLAKPGDLAYILFTSGSTGNPKGVEVTHDNVVNLLHSMNQIFELGNKEQMLASTTISFDIAGLEMFLPLVTGNTMVLAPSAVAKDGPALLKFIQHHRITWMQATPATYKMLLASGWNEKLAIKVSCCGEQLPKDLADKMLTRCQAFYNMYGPTETTIYSSGIKLEPHYGTITIGRPIHNTAFYILDANLKLCPPNTEGEIYIGGKGVAKGYIHQPELTKERFIPNPYSTTGVPAPILFRTGDLGKWTETGNIICLGRTDHQIKVRGYRIELPEIEYQLKQIDGIKDAVVAAHPDPTGEKQLVAYIVATNDSFDKNNINKILKNVLPAYMIPVHYVGMDVLPLSESRKVDRKALPAPQNIFTTPTSVGAMTEQHSELHTTLQIFGKKRLA
ncbi:MAG: amino acid adenylation domain-containing protein, partial [Chitinophagia bacterium]|nr:amino acid adenylation domain-containing protein [Chitinophagia bacterium]